MCVIAFSWQPRSSVPLLLAANRDEFYARPTLPLHRWNTSDTWAGRDLQAGGTWLGIGAGGRVAALTNYRDASPMRPDARSRGQITTEFLESSVSSEHYLDRLAPQAHLYNPFNLLVFDGTELVGFESRHRRAFRVPEGIHGVSNADFNTPWPKLVRLREGLAQAIGQHDFTSATLPSAGIDALFSLLSDRRPAADEALPRTGIPLERERALSATFIQTPDYGTRASSLLLVGRGRADFIELRFDGRGFTGEVHVRPSFPSGEVSFLKP